MRVELIGGRSLLQGTLPGAGAASRWRVRRLEAVVLDAPAVAGAPTALVHYHRDQLRPDSPWVRGELVCPDAVGPGRIAQQRSCRGRQGDLHALVPVASQGGALTHFRRAGTGDKEPWTCQGTVADEATWLARVGAEAETTPPSAGLPTDAVAIAIARTSLGLPGPIGEWLAGLPGGDRGLAGPARRPGGAGWQQALVQEGRSLYLWHRQTWRGRTRWVRACCLRFDPAEGVAVASAPSVKVAQVTGEFDSQPDSGGQTLSTSVSRSGVRGTDLGVRIDHQGSTYLLFGDTHWTRPFRATLDAIGQVSWTSEPGGLPRIELHGSPIRARGRAVTTREYDVPLDAFSVGEALFCFFSSNHFVRHQVMGRSVLARSRRAPLAVQGRQRRRPIDFDVLATFSDQHFINVSAVLRGERLYVFGSGSYRASDLRLAELALDASAVRAALAGRRPWTRPLPGLRYWTGLDPAGQPRWAGEEAASVAVLPGALGELSVRWVPEVERYALLAMSGPEDPVGPAVTLRWARDPWGPWSSRQLLFDWVAGGMRPDEDGSRFIRSNPVDDPVGDAIFSVQARMTGGAYAPYLFDTRLDGSTLVLRYTLSTWNPYQVVLMEHRLDVRTVG